MTLKAEQQKRKTVCIDFDGVIHSYVSDWTVHEEIPDPPVQGAFEFIREVLTEYDVVVLSVRAETTLGRHAMYAWMIKHGMTFDEITEIGFTHVKPRAVIYIDDRGFHFKGKFPPLDFLRSFKPWNREPVEHFLPPGAAKLDDAVAHACKEPTLVDALSWIAVWENDRAVRQALLGERGADGRLWDTCFRHCFAAVFAAYEKPQPDSD